MATAMQGKSAPEFGRRGAPPLAPKPVKKIDGPPVFANDAIVPTIPTVENAEATSDRYVPRSRTAALLAGVVVGCLNTAVILQGGALRLHEIAGAALPPLDPALALSAAVASGLVAGIGSASSALFIVRTGLNALHRTGFVEYVVTGGAAAALYAIAAQSLRSGVPDHGVYFAAATGAMSALLFRLFAGTSAR